VDCEEEFDGEVLDFCEDLEGDVLLDEDVFFFCILHVYHGKNDGVLGFLLHGNMDIIYPGWEFL